MPIEFFEGILTLGAENDAWLEIPGNPGFSNGNLFSRPMECLGSQINNRNFIVADETLNLLMQLFNPISEKTLPDKIKDDRINTKSGPNVFGKVGLIMDDILKQLNHAEIIWKEEHPDIEVRISLFFIEWIQDYFAKVTTRAKQFLPNDNGRDEGSLGRTDGRDSG
ncbi:hypothetical protein QQZ08_010276 [Neonectria magnoliae]|uniref:Uncharacterized protein n=1 Tax=Neonectria magnoliae TaxID=2732573 RepID=A0ABR1HIG5_9HYPO